MAHSTDNAAGLLTILHFNRLGVGGICLVFLLSIPSRKLRILILPRQQEYIYIIQRVSRSATKKAQKRFQRRTVPWLSSRPLEPLEE